MYISDSNLANQRCRLQPVQTISFVEIPKNNRNCTRNQWNATSFVELLEIQRHENMVRKRLLSFAEMLPLKQKPVVERNALGRGIKHLLIDFCYIFPKEVSWEMIRACIRGFSQLRQLWFPKRECL